MKSRRAARELAVQCLYLMDLCKLDAQSACEMIFTSALTTETRVLCRRWTLGVETQKENIDTLLKKYITNWDTQRLAAIDRNVLRLAIYEILNEFETPLPVIMDEAIELVKTYSTSDSGKFVNGILDKVKIERRIEN